MIIGGNVKTKKAKPFLPPLSSLTNGYRFMFFEDNTYLSSISVKIAKLKLLQKLL